MSTTKPIVVSIPEWEPSNVRYMQPKINDRGAKSITLISTQSNRALHLSTPLMKTWGIADYVDEKGESDGKFSMSLIFPNEDYETAGTTQFLEKMKSFENQILDDAVKYSEAWFGEDLSREVVKHNFFPFLKYSKDKNTKKTDYTKPPTVRARIPNYNNKWGVEIYDTSQDRIFPSENDDLTPMDFVPKLSSVACVLQCGGLWFGGKGWGLTWKVNQIVVKPREVISVYGKCHIQLSQDEMKEIEESPSIDPVDSDQVAVAQPTTNIEVADSDDDIENESQSEAEEEPVKKKKTVKKQEPVNDPDDTPAPKKKVVKKKVNA
jgi:hypothetical protein